MIILEQDLFIDFRSSYGKPKRGEFFTGDAEPVPLLVTRENARCLSKAVAGDEPCSAFGLEKGRVAV
jgi:hypothetical protein